MIQEYNFKDKWDENTDISWWNECRKKLNKIIKKYNNWQIYDKFNYDKAQILLAKIEKGKQTIGSRDGGSGYMEELEEMENFIRNNIN